MILYHDDYRQTDIFKFLKELEWENHYYNYAKYFERPNPKVKRLKNIGTGQRCFILGNGPSLNLLDLSLLKREITFGVNSIFLNYENMGFEPTYYVVEDPLVARERALEINSLVNNSIKFIYRRYADIIFETEKTVYFQMYDYFGYNGFPYFSTEFDKYCWIGGTVSYTCMQLAFYLGFSSVYLIGFDHKYSISMSSKINGLSIRTLHDDENHFHPDYFGKGTTWHIPNVERMETSYKKAKKVYEKSGRKIYNATKGGALEVFERVDFVSLFS